MAQGTSWRLAPSRAQLRVLLVFVAVGATYAGVVAWGGLGPTIFVGRSSFLGGLLAVSVVVLCASSLLTVRHHLRLPLAIARLLPSQADEVERAFRTMGERELFRISVDSRGLDSMVLLGSLERAGHELRLMSEAFTGRRDHRPAGLEPFET